MKRKKKQNLLKLKEENVKLEIEETIKDLQDKLEKSAEVKESEKIAPILKVDTANDTTKTTAEKISSPRSNIKFNDTDSVCKL